MEDLLFPSSVAVIGATANPANLAKNIVENLLDAGFKGPIYPVAPSGGEVHGLQIHKSITEIPGEVDFAAILIPAANIPAVLEECGRKGVRRVLISSGGFDEFSLRDLFPELFDELVEPASGKTGVGADAQHVPLVIERGGSAPHDLFSFQYQHVLARI